MCKVLCFSVKTRKMKCNTEIGRHAKKRDKNYKKSKRLHLEREIGFTTSLERRMRVDLIEIFNMINGISHYDRHFCNIPYQAGIFCENRFQELNLLNHFFFFC